MVYRIDALEQSSAPVRTDDGRVFMDGRFTRAGVFKYRNPDGTIRREYRPESEVFKTDSMDSFKNLVVTNGHPPKLLTAQTAKKHAVGMTGSDIRRDSNYLSGRVIVFDGAATADIDSGKHQLSCGYSVREDHTPGVHPQYGAYDLVQRDIRGNHVSIEDRGRAGAGARLRTDSLIDAAIMISAEPPNPIPEGKLDMADNFQTQVIELTTQAAKASARADIADAKVAEMEAKLKVAEDRATKSDAERDSVKAELEAEKKARTDAAADLPAQVRARVEMEGVVRSLKLDVKDLETQPDAKLQQLVIEKVDGAELTEKQLEPLYLQTRYDSACARVAQSGNKMDSLGEVLKGRQDGANTDPEAVARAAMLAHNQKTFDEG